ncbi:MAG: MgtC/SapB family protein [Lachnospiraceae bacterium]|nr:MgtC/SapB family protein [Lachnospiraceae bacterium]
MLLTAETLKNLTFDTILLRLLTAMFLGGLVGLERTRKNQPAGFRTFMIVSMGAALTMIFAIFEFNLISEDFARAAIVTGVSIDVARYSAQVINGIGFLAAGMILVTGQQQISGITTASSLMASACMGIAAGAGFYECVLVVLPVVLISISLLPRIEEFIQERSPHMSLYVEFKDMEHLGSLLVFFKEQKTQVYEIDVEEQANNDRTLPSAVFALRLPRKVHHADMIAMVAARSYVMSIREL